MILGVLNHVRLHVLRGHPGDCTRPEARCGFGRSTSACRRKIVFQGGHWPVRVYGNMRPIIVDDSTGSVEDLLVALDLGDDLLLHLQWRQGDLMFFEF